MAVENIRQICQNIARYPSDFPKFHRQNLVPAAPPTTPRCWRSAAGWPPARWPSCPTLRSTSSASRIDDHIGRCPRFPPSYSTSADHHGAPSTGLATNLHTHSDSVTKSMGTHDGWQCPHRLKYASHTRATVGGMMDPGFALTSLSTIRPVAGSLSATLMERHSCVFDQLSSYLLRAILMSTWGFLPAVFRPLRTVFPGLGAVFLNLAGKTEGTAKQRGKTGERWARHGLKRVGVS